LNKIIANKVLTRDKGRCIYCGSPRVELHHIVYKSHQGADIEENLVCLCRHHHTLVHTDEHKYRDELIARQSGIYGALEISDLKKKSKWSGFKYE
jgi:5-methylcytosine-specific restriction endonuclease McrA